MDAWIIRYADGETQSEGYTLFSLMHEIKHLEQGTYTILFRSENGHTWEVRSITIGV